MAQLAPAVVDVQACLAIAAGCLLIVQGLWATGLLPRLPGSGLIATCGLARLIGPFLRGTGIVGYFVAGLFTGFLPCGLVYAYLALATASGSMGKGLLLMAAFGLGTAPLMILAGWGGAALTGRARQRLFRMAAACVVATGMVSVVRGAYSLRPHATAEEAGCPFCVAAEGK